MKRTLFIISLIFPSFLYCQSATDIIRQSEEKMRGTTSQAIIIIRTIRPSWSREMKVRAWLKGSEYSVLLITSPVRDKGIVFLKRKKEVWNWMPSIEKTIKLPPSMMSQSWMGTDFTNDDLVKESSLITDYTHSFNSDTIIQNRTCYTITMIPKSDAAIVWGKLIVCIDKERLVQLHIRFYDEENALINTMNASEVKMMDGRLIPTRFEMYPADKKNNKTEMIYESILFNRVLDDAFFTIDKMRYISGQ